MRGIKLAMVLLGSGGLGLLLALLALLAMLEKLALLFRTNEGIVHMPLTIMLIGYQNSLALKRFKWSLEGCNFFEGSLVV